MTLLLLLLEEGGVQIYLLFNVSGGTRRRRHQAVGWADLRIPRALALCPRHGLPDDVLHSGGLLFRGEALGRGQRAEERVDVVVEHQLLEGLEVLPVGAPVLGDVAARHVELFLALEDGVLAARREVRVDLC